MAQQYWKLFIHAVWCTKHRSSILRGDLETVAHQAIRDTARDIGIIPICVNSAWNHTHVLLSWNPSIAIEEGLQMLKDRAVLQWRNHPGSKAENAHKLEWQPGWAAFSVSPGKVQNAKSYVVHQKLLHRNGGVIKHYEGMKGHRG